jgi:hypothetical protein
MYVSFRPAACIEWAYIRDILYWRVVIKSTEIIEACLKSDKNIGNFIRRHKYSTFYIVGSNNCNSAVAIPSKERNIRLRS